MRPFAEIITRRMEFPSQKNGRTNNKYDNNIFTPKKTKLNQNKNLDGPEKCVYNDARSFQQTLKSIYKTDKKLIG